MREIDTRFGTGVGYAYDSASRLTAKVYPDGSAVHYAYDGAGRTVGISDPFGDTTRFVYDAAGRRVQKLGTKGLRTEYAYAPGTGWLTGVTSTTETGGLAAAFTYPTHDDVGNRLAMTETSGGATSYTYDALDRLATLDPPDESIYPANGALTEFAYDAAGNRTDFGPKSGGSFASPHVTYTYNAATKRLLNIKKDGAIVETLGGYDGNGNPATWTPPGSAARTLKFDALGRLVSITGGFSASYAYDPFGRRIEKTEQTVTTRYQYDGLDVVAEYSASQLEATYVFGPGIDEVLKLKRGTTLAAYHSDGLGSVVSITDSSNGASLKTYRYDAFGKAIAQTGTLANAYTYTGREQDASGLYYYRARYYLPSAGRFLTPDPIGLAGGINAYAYVGSNPVNYTDPFGLKAYFGPASPWGSQALAQNFALDQTEEWHYTRNRMVVPLPDGMTQIEALGIARRELSTFDLLDLPSPNLASVRIEGDTAFFDLLGYAGLGNDLSSGFAAGNDAEWAVRLTRSNDVQIGTTLDRHALQGIRLWYAEPVGERSIAITTEAFEVSRGVNILPAALGVSSRMQAEMWDTFFTNISTMRFGGRGVLGAPVERRWGDNPPSVHPYIGYIHERR